MSCQNCGSDKDAMKDGGYTAKCDVCDKNQGTTTRTVAGIETWVCDECRGTNEAD